MNGRIYDPLLGRFLSADIAIQSPLNLQSYNRYTYVMNNPLTLTDPTGFYSILGLEFTDGGGVGGFFNDLASYTASATTGAAGGLYGATVGGAVNAGNEAGQMYIDSRDSGSSGVASFGYAASQGFGRFTGGTGLVEFYSGTKIESGTDGSLTTGDFSSVSDWAVHGAASYAQTFVTAVGVKGSIESLAQAAPKTGPAPEVNPTKAPTTDAQNTSSGSSSSLTQQQQSAVSKINNAVDDHLTPKDVSGAVHDQVGNPIQKPGGGVWDHTKEVGDAMRGVRKNVGTLKDVDHPAAQAAVAKGKGVLQSIEDALKGLGL
jgi:hypothetical protein